jgi:hypothetical protein
MAGVKPWAIHNYWFVHMDATWVCGRAWKGSKTSHQTSEWKWITQQHPWKGTCQQPTPEDCTTLLLHCLSVVVNTWNPCILWNWAQEGKFFEPVLGHVQIGHGVKTG